ncbi:uncharacterized membrane protein YhaH (DUF805 family) [Celeribacter persicus]|uniref:Uncharacterized membrane protein YhaH (DUF805 family) n=2 Tax=Celeribacter persicus TaxID=1651082 RepID=A0A2T5HPI0_9RHOB|nr:uncharacterized membrane protein YhaH (DUF805 family) [Celeribacter persicus]
MAGPLKAVENGYFRAFNFSGRASRSEFWWFAIYYTIVSGLLVIDLTNGGTLFIWFVLLNIIPNLSMTIRRLHDIGRSGFWFFISFVPIVGPIILLIFYLLPSEPHRNVWGDPEHGGSMRPRDRFSGRSAQSGYAALTRIPEAGQVHSDEFEEARRQEIHDYYRRRVLGQNG